MPKSTRSYTQKEGPMSALKTGLAVAIPVAVAGTAGLVIKKMTEHDGKVTEEVKKAAKDSVHEMENAVSEFRNNLEGKSANQLDKNIDNIVENTKNRIDRIAAQLKNKLRVEQMKAKARA